MSRPRYRRHSDWPTFLSLAIAIIATAVTITWWSSLYAECRDHPPHAHSVSYCLGRGAAGG